VRGVPGRQAKGRESPHESVVSGRLAKWPRPGRRVAWLVLAVSLQTCTGRSASAPAPAPPLRFDVLGNASGSDSGSPTLQVDSQIVTIRGVDVLTKGAGLYGDVDLSEPHTLRLTLYDSAAGRPISDPLPAAPPSDQRQVLYQARIGPVRPGRYEVWVGRYQARAKLIEVSHQPLQIVVPPAPRAPASARARQSRDST
jgi:hypothetical protein